MNNFQNVYITQESRVGSEMLRYLFLSQGDKDIVKVVQYEYVRDFGGRRVFNLGFGNYNVATNSISDEEVSNNKDQYKVFHTVLNTIPRLFDVYGHILLMVQGSDSRPEFIEKCRTACTKKCETELCKKAHQRINIYGGFIDKNFKSLSEGYVFKGSEGLEDHSLIEPYEIGGKYKTIFVMKKNP